MSLLRDPRRAHPRELRGAFLVRLGAEKIEGKSPESKQKPTKGLVNMGFPAKPKKLEPRAIPSSEKTSIIA